MIQALTSAVAVAARRPPEEQDVLAAILLEEVASEQIGMRAGRLQGQNVLAGIVLLLGIKQ